MSQGSSSSISITATFTFPQNQSSHDQIKVFDDTDCEPSIIGLPDGTEPKKPVAGDYAYSGVHDHGILPPPKEGGDFALMLGLVNKARKHSDELLTKIIEEQNRSRKKHEGDQLDSVQEKKHKY